MKKSSLKVSRQVTFGRRNERGTVTVEWMMVIVVALLVLVGLYNLATWAMKSTNETIKETQGNKSSQGKFTPSNFCRAGSAIYLPLG